MVYAQENRLFVEKGYRWKLVTCVLIKIKLTNIAGSLIVLK